MAARKTTKGLGPEWRKKIQTSMLINRLEKYIKGEIKMEPAQVTAALGLLKKSLPDLQSETIQHLDKNGETMDGFIIRVIDESRKR